MSRGSKDRHRRSDGYITTGSVAGGVNSDTGGDAGDISAGLTPDLRTSILKYPIGASLRWRETKIQSHCSEPSIE
jgi:hypothetical protein